MTRPTVPAILGTLAVAAGLAVVLGGFAVNGSPSTRRALALDARRVDTLMTIANAINAQNYEPSGASKPAYPLPKTLDELVQRQNVYLRADQLKDPATGVPYTYRAKGETAYELCATFTHATPDRSDAGVYRDETSSEFWSHGPGEKCFGIDATKPVY